jgi:hypothetical protein
MSGFHDHLLTMSQGTHIKPTIKQPGGKLKAMEDAVNPLVGFDHDLAAYLGAETDLTPYAKLVAVLEKIRDNPSKPVTHGQFKIMKLNVVDKFGQVAHALDPRWDAPSRNIRPCLSDFVAPQMSEKTPNIVERPREGEGVSSYVQIPPHINQMARLNTAFVKHNDKEQWVPQNGD